MKLDKVIGLFKTHIFVCQEKIKFASCLALQKLHCSCFYIVLSFVCVKFVINSRNSFTFATVYISSFVVCFQSTAEI